MKNIRAWATPLTMGAFCLMSVTGILIFFHLDSGFNKTAHEWLSWFLVIGVAGHAFVNWPSVKKYLTTSTLARYIVGAFILVLALSFIQLGGGKGLPPPVMAMKAITKSPITVIAPLTGKSAEQVLTDLLKAGITLPSTSATLDSVLKGDRELEKRAMAVLFGGKEPETEGR